MLRNKKMYGALAVLGALTLLMGVTSVAYAQGPQPPAGGRPFSDDCPFLGQTTGLRGLALPGKGWGVRGQSLVDATAEVTGLARDEVIAALQDGETFAEIANAAGVDLQDIADSVVAGRETMLKEAVDEGSLTEEQVDQILAVMSEHLLERLAQGWTSQSSAMRGNRGGFGRGWAR